MKTKKVLLIFPLLLILCFFFNCKRVTNDALECTFTGLKADFSYNYEGENPPAIVYFENLSKNATSYEWDFGVDGGKSNQKDPIYVYQESGLYTITLKAIVTLENGDQCFEMASKTISIN
ncbi:MAG: PKD domain-containing protein [Bacteroidales bacterium]